MSARQFGRDSGDVYGRHALREPGGDNVQRDVFHVLGDNRGIHPMRFDPDYVGRHRRESGQYVLIHSHGVAFGLKTLHGHTTVRALR